MIWRMKIKHKHPETYQIDTENHGVIIFHILSFNRLQIAQGIIGDPEKISPRRIAYDLAKAMEDMPSAISSIGLGKTK